MTCCLEDFVVVVVLIMKRLVVKMAFTENDTLTLLRDLKKT